MFACVRASYFTVTNKVEHVSGRLRDPGQIYQGLLAEGVYQPRSDTSLGAHASRYTFRARSLAGSWGRGQWKSEADVISTQE